jgi:hypothetical protein
MGPDEKSNTISILAHVVGMPEQTAVRAGLYAFMIALDAIAAERIREALEKVAEHPGTRRRR